MNTNNLTANRTQLVECSRSVAMIRQFFALKNINKLIKNVQMETLAMEMVDHNKRASINRQFDIIIAKSAESLKSYDFNRTCIYWKENKCIYGEKCLFRHQHDHLIPKEATQQSQPYQQQQPSVQQIRESIPCRNGDDCEFYQQGNCRYSHKSNKRYKKKDDNISDESDDGISEDGIFDSEMKEPSYQVTPPHPVVQQLQKKLSHNQKVYQQQQSYETKLKQFEAQVKQMTPKLETMEHLPYWTQQQIDKIIRKHNSKQSKKSQSVPPMSQPPIYKHRNVQPQITPTAANPSLSGRSPPQQHQASGDVTVDTNIMDNEDEDSKQMECHDTITPDVHAAASHLKTPTSTTISSVPVPITPATIDFDSSNYLEWGRYMLIDIVISLYPNYSGKNNKFVFTAMDDRKLIRDIYKRWEKQDLKIPDGDLNFINPPTTSSEQSIYEQVAAIVKTSIDQLYQNFNKNRMHVALRPIFLQQLWIYTLNHYIYNILHCGLRLALSDFASSYRNEYFDNEVRSLKERVNQQYSNQVPLWRIVKLLRNEIKKF